MQEVAVMAAVDRLNALLVTLPELIPCLIEGIYPEFGYPDCGSEKYLALLEDQAAYNDVCGLFHVPVDGLRCFGGNVSTARLICLQSWRHVGISCSLCARERSTKYMWTAAYKMCISL